MQPRALTHLGWVLATALVGAAGNEAVATYRIRAGRRIGSAALVAEGQHARTDALSSLAVVIGVAAAWAGYPQLDPIIGLLIAAVIIAVLITSMRTVIRRLMDGIEDDTLDRIEAATASFPGVVSVEHARARWTGHRLHAEIQIGLDRALSVTAAHHITERVHQSLISSIPHLDRATFHTHPAGK